jgi:hypothetical protein
MMIVAVLPQSCHCTVSVWESGAAIMVEIYLLSPINYPELPSSFKTITVISLKKNKLHQ